MLIEGDSTVDDMRIDGMSINYKLSLIHTFKHTTSSALIVIWIDAPCKAFLANLVTRVLSRAIKGNINISKLHCFV